MKLFQDLLGAAKIKPNQIKGDVISDQQTFGTLIQNGKLRNRSQSQIPNLQTLTISESILAHSSLGISVK